MILGPIKSVFTLTLIVLGGSNLSLVRFGSVLSEDPSIKCGDGPASN